MGILSTISKLKDKIRGTTTDKDGEYIPLEKLPPKGVEVYREPTASEKIASAKTYVKQKVAERQLYKKEKLERQAEQIKAENERIKEENKNLALRKKNTSLGGTGGTRPLALQRFASNLNKALGSNTAGQSKTIGSRPPFGENSALTQERPKPKKDTNIFGGGNNPFG